MLLLLVACSTIEKIGDTATTTTPAGLCEGEIYVPQAGFDATAAVLADADAATFGTVAPDPFQVHLSFAGDPGSTASLVWRTDGDTLATRVEYGVDDAYGASTVGRSFFAGTEADAEWGRVHEAHLCGLSPATTYHYRVGGEGHWSEDRSFTTAPGAGSPVRFGVAGDSRDNQAVWGQILAAMEPMAPDLYMFSGDMVDLGTNLAEWDAFFENGEGYLDRRPIVMAHGNHEFQVQPFYALAAQPGNEQWFSFDWGDAHFVVLNDTVAASGDREVQAQWMATDLAETDRAWKLAFHHIPAYSSCTTHGSNSDLQELWSPVEEAGGVAFDFAGHNHNYERSHPLRGGVQVAAEEGTTYVVSAGAGADLYGNEGADAFTASYAVANHFVMVEIEGDAATLTAYDLAGNVLDTFTTTR